MVTSGMQTFIRDPTIKKSVERVRRVEVNKSYSHKPASGLPYWISKLGWISTFDFYLSSLFCKYSYWRDSWHFHKAEVAIFKENFHRGFKSVHFPVTRFLKFTVNVDIESTVTMLSLTLAEIYSILTTLVLGASLNFSQVSWSFWHHSEINLTVLKTY